MTNKNVPTGITQEEYDIAHSIIVDGSDKDPITIKTELINKGISLLRYEIVYEIISIDEGFIRNPVDIRNEIKNKIERKADTFCKIESYEKDIEPLIQSILEKVDKSDEQTILRMLKAKFKALDLEFPKKEHRTRKTKPTLIEKAIVSAFVSKITVEKDEYMDIVMSLAPKAKNKWEKLYKMFLNISEGQELI